MKKLAVLFCCVLMSLPVAAQADKTPPVPPRKSEALDFQKSLLKTEAQKKILEEKVASIESDLQDTKGRLISIGRSVQNSESALQELEARIADLEKAKAKTEATLEGDRQSIARLVLALERIRRVPPEALIVQPGAPLKTAQSAMLMRDIMPAIHKQATQLRANLENLDRISKDLTSKRDKVAATSAKLKQEQASLSALVKKRESLYASTHEDLQEQKESARRISAQAQNLQDLVRKLDRQREEDNKKAAAAQRMARATALPSPGQARLPVSGNILVAYDEPDAFGAPSKGVKIETRDGALVVAPMGGVVRFAGTFKNYGNMIIIEHKNGYHSLIAGLQKVDTVVGQTVAAGEPLGFLQNGAGSTKPVLYYELRLKGQPVNPVQKLADLG